MVTVGYFNINSTCVSAKLATYVIGFLCLGLSAANATKFYGEVPSIDQFTKVNEHVKSVVDGDISVRSVFTTGDFSIHNGSDFLADGGFGNRTLINFLQSVMESPAELGHLSRRANGPKCINDAVSSSFSTGQEDKICDNVKGLLSDIVIGVSVIVDKKACSETASGHPVGCSVLVAIIFNHINTFTTSEVGTACLNFMKKNDGDCKGAGAQGTTVNGKGVGYVVHSQASPQCSDIRGACIETTM